MALATWHLCIFDCPTRTGRNNDALGWEHRNSSGQAAAKEQRFLICYISKKPSPVLDQGRQVREEETPTAELKHPRGRVVTQSRRSTTPAPRSQQRQSEPQTWRNQGNLMPAKVRKRGTVRNIEQGEHLVWYGGTIPRNPLSPPQTCSPVQPVVNGAFSYPRFRLQLSAQTTRRWHVCGCGRSREVQR
jgi:hypothetical protein